MTEIVKETKKNKLINEIEEIAEFRIELLAKSILDNDPVKMETMKAQLRASMMEVANTILKDDVKTMRRLEETIQTYKDAYETSTRQYNEMKEIAENAINMNKNRLKMA